MGRIATCYGVDLGGDHLVIVRSVGGRKGVHHEVLWDGVLSPGGSGPSSIVSPIQEDVEKGQACVAGAVDVRESVTRWLTTPFPSVSKARRVLPSLLDIQLPFPLEDCTYDFLGVRGTAEHVRALAVAARTKSIEARMAAYSAAGLDPAILDHEGLALWVQSVEELPIEPETVRIVAYIGHDRSVLAIGRGLRFENAHNCRVGLEGFAPESARDFAERARRVVRAHLQGVAGQAVQWVWTGPGAGRSSCRETLQQALDFEHEVSFLVHDDPGSFLARALGARALAEEPLRCNLRKGALAHPQETKREAARRLRAAAACTFLGLVLMVLGGAWHGIMHLRGVRVREELSELARELTGYPTVPTDQEVYVTKAALETQRSLDAPFLRAFEPSLTVVLADLLRAAQAYQMSLENLSLRADQVAVHGTSADWSDCEKIADVLRARGYDVAEPERSDAGADERVHFSVKGTARE